MCMFRGHSTNHVMQDTRLTSARPSLMHVGTSSQFRCRWMRSKCLGLASPHTPLYSRQRSKKKLLLITCAKQDVLWFT